MFFALITLIASTAANAAPTCLDNFNERLLQASTYDQKQQLLIAQGHKDMACLYANASPRIDASFFLDQSHLQRNKIQKFFGVNGLTVGRKFEKHFFKLLDEKGGTEILGYNTSAFGKITKSPGLFLLIESKIDKSSSTSVTLDYTPDFESKLRLKLSQDQLGKLQGLELAAIKNSKGNLLFHDLRDTLHTINDEIAVGKAERVVKGKTTFVSYFLILKKPD